MQNITEAIEEVNLIKKVIDRTQNDFSKIANFFVVIGIMNAVTYLLCGVMFQVLRGDGTGRIYGMDGFSRIE